MTDHDRPSGDDPPPHDSSFPASRETRLFADNKPPALPEAEQQLVSILLQKPASFDVVADLVDARFFTEDAFGRLWEVIVEFNRRGIVEPGWPLLVDRLAQEFGWEKGEVGQFIAGLLKGVVSTSASQLRHYAVVLKDAWVRRQLWDAAADIRERAIRGPFDSSGAQILEDIEARLFAIGQEGGSADSARTIGQAIDDAIKEAQAAAETYEAGGIVGVASGISAIDKKLGGWRAGDVVIVASRPGMGKTSFALRITEAAARQFMALDPDRPQWVLKFSLEMGAEQLATRALSSEAEVSFERIRLGHATVSDFQKLGLAAQDLRGLPIMIDDMARVSVSSMRTKARRLARKRGLGLIIIDYLQLVGLSSEERKEAGGNRVQEVSHITRSLKVLAKELNVPILVLCQLNREVEKREDKRPQLSDLRESGSIEQDADQIAFLYREAYYLEQRPPAKREKEKELEFQLRRSEWSIALDRARTTAEFLIAKNRHGSGGTLHLRFNPELMRFEDDLPGDASPSAREQRKAQLAMELMTND